MNLKKENKELFKLETEGDTSTLIFLAPLTIEQAPLYDEHLDFDKACGDIKKLILDFSHIRQYDSFFILLSESFRKKAKDCGIETQLKGMPDAMIDFLETMQPRRVEEEKPEKDESAFVGYFYHIGETVLSSLGDMRRFVEFAGELTAKMLYIFYKPGAIRWKDFPFHFTRSGVGAVPIVVLIVFLIGLISGYQGAVQLARFGADVFIADLVGIAITRELAPLMTAILVAGRSGSAFAAELGTMKVSEEIDALETMGFDSMTFLIIPRILSVVIAMPLLTLITDIAGIAGGLVAALGTLDISFSGYINQLQIAVGYEDIASGLIKSIVYGFLISAVGCFRGMQVRGGAESVGRYTTASVVTGVFLIILSDAVFTFLFQAVGW